MELDKLLIVVESAPDGDRAVKFELQDMLRISQDGVVHCYQGQKIPTLYSKHDPTSGIV